MSKIRFLKNLDSLLGRFLCTVLPRAGKSQSGPIEKILLIRPGGIGDAVLLVPAIKRFRHKYPAAQIDILAEKRNAGLFELVPEVGQVFHYDSLSGLLAVLWSRYDVVIDTEQWHRLSAVVARSIRARLRVGFGTNERQRMFNPSIDYSHDDYESESFAHLLSPLGVDISTPSDPPFLHCPDSEQQKVDALLSPLEGKPFVVIFPGASISERQWGSDKFSVLAGQIAAAGLGVVVVGGAQDKVVGDVIVKNIETGINLVGQCNLAGSAGIIARSQLLVSGDSGILHVGVGVGRPTVSLFGPGIAAKWAPRGEQHRVINKHRHCSPCTRFGSTPQCPYAVECMKQIFVNEVFEAVNDLLAQEDTKV
jgi:lipopolysaccharide heptosyltransferase II